MGLKIINYSIKILIILLGILLVTGVFFPAYPDKSLMRVMGGILILWGVYRIIVYRINLKKYSGGENE